MTLFAKKDLDNDSCTKAKQNEVAPGEHDDDGQAAAQAASVPPPPPPPPPPLMPYQNIYPSIPHSPPAYVESKKGDDKDPLISSSPLSGRLRSKKGTGKDMSGRDAENFPMIQVPNPNTEPGHPEHLYVFRPWTDAECTNACVGLTLPDVDFDTHTAEVN